RPTYVAILPEKCGADRVGSASMKAAGEGDDLFASRVHPGHAHRVFIRFSTGVTEECLLELSRCDCRELLCRTRADVGIDEVRIEKKFIRLRLQRTHDVWVTMTGPRDSVAAVEIE